jgi:hypothetical protein
MAETATVLIEEAPEFEFSGGLFYVRDGQGVRAMRPTAFFQGFHSAAQAMQDYHARTSGEVIPVDFNSKFERVFPADKSA